MKLGKIFYFILKETQVSFYKKILWAALGILFFIGQNRFVPYSQ